MATSDAIRRKFRRIFTHFDTGHNLHSIPAFLFMFHGIFVWFRYVSNGFIFDLDNINSNEMSFSLITFIISNLSAFFYVVPHDTHKHPTLLGMPGDVWIAMYKMLILWSFWNTWLLWRFLPNLYPQWLNNLRADKILSIFFLLIPVPHGIETFKKMMIVQGGFHSVQLSLWSAFILFPINVCLFISGPRYIEKMNVCWKYQSDFLIAMCYFTNFGYMTSFFMVTLYRKRVKYVRNKLIFSILFVFSLIFMGFIPMIELIIYPQQTSFLNWVTEEPFGAKGNIFGEISCEYPHTIGTAVNNSFLNSTVISSIVTCGGFGWICWKIVEFTVNTKKD